MRDAIWLILPLLLLLLAPAGARAQPGPSTTTRPFEGIWVGRGDSQERVILEIELTVLGPMEVRWMILPMGSGTMNAGRCTQTVVAATRWVCNRGDPATGLPGETRVRIADATHLELWWPGHHVLVERIANGLRWHGSGRP